MQDNWRDQFINTEDEVVRTGFDAIKKITGILQPPKRIPGTKSFDGKPPKDQLLLTLTAAQILEIDKGAKMPELEDDEWHKYFTWAAKGEQPTKGSTVAKSLIRSAEQLWKARGQTGKGWLDFVGQQVTLERRSLEWVLSEKPSKTDDGDGEGLANPDTKKNVRTGKSDAWYFVENENAEPTDVLADIRDRLVIGQKAFQVQRGLVMDAVAKRHPELKEMFNRKDGTFEDALGVCLDENGVYVKAEALASA